ncbi:MAG: hypothetical protein B6U72_06725 [Candidatus Altiarchaeales archaeon ex4484_2]|nr:MAG: hypothetical protein B6U72_06725 [Candidatus Altiarchaeales archaeon ex4484_2]
MDASVKKIIKETLPVLVLTTIGGITAGIFLENVKHDIIVKIPGLLILLPAILGNRGNIAGALGSRLSSALHLGLIDAELKWNKMLQDNLYATILLNITISFLLGIVAWCAYKIAGFPGDASIIELTLIALIAGTLAGILLALLTILLAIYTSSKGLDPDNILMPLVSTVGDIATIICLIFAVWIVELMI